MAGSSLDTLADLGDRHVIYSDCGPCNRSIRLSTKRLAAFYGAKLYPADVEMQVMRSTGAGGQSVNTTDSAVRLKHIPTGIVVKCQQEKSQTKNRNMAMRMLRAKLYELEQERITSARDSLRRGQVGTGDRSEKIRTYNFPQDRLTDHRIGMTWHNLPARMAGDIEDIVVACRTFFQAEQLKAESTRPQPEA